MSLYLFIDKIIQKQYKSADFYRGDIRKTKVELIVCILF